jgi:hypothetical protein
MPADGSVKQIQQYTFLQKAMRIPSRIAPYKK